MTVGIAVLIAVVAIGVSVFLSRYHEATRAAVEDPDYLEEAEEEVRDLDTFADPDDAEEDLPDWGPGVPPN